MKKIKFSCLVIIGVALMLTCGCKKSADDNNTDDPPVQQPTPTASVGINFNPTITYGTVIDTDNNIYKTITIACKGTTGTTTWMAENLRATHYRNGNPITNVTDSTAWSYLATGAYCDYLNTPSVSNTYGRLYNWYAVNTGNLAPKGWHVATDSNWLALFAFLGGETIAGAKLEETDTAHWLAPNTQATNEIGFTALPSGGRYALNGSFNQLGTNCFFWSSTAADATRAWYYYIDANNSQIVRWNYEMRTGCSVRCVKD